MVSGTLAVFSILLMTSGVWASRLKLDPDDASLVQLEKDSAPMGAWGFSKNIINIDTFFAAPSKSDSKSLSQRRSGSNGGGEATAEALEEHQETAEERR